MPPEQESGLSEVAQRGIWDAPVYPPEGAAKVIDAVVLARERGRVANSNFYDARLEPGYARTILSAIQDDIHLCKDSEGTGEYQNMVDQRLNEGIRKLATLPLGQAVLAEANKRLFDAAIEAMANPATSPRQRAYLGAYAVAFGITQIPKSEKLRPLLECGLEHEQAARKRFASKADRAAATARVAAVQECLSVIELGGKIAIGKTRTREQFDAGKQVTVRAVTAAALTGLGIGVGAVPSDAKNAQPEPVAVEQTTSAGLGLDKSVTIELKPSRKPAQPQPVAAPQVMQQTAKKAETVVVAPRQKPVPTVVEPVQIKETTARELGGKDAPLMTRPIQAEIPDDTPKVKTGETPAQALARVVRLGKSNAGANIILEQSTSPMPDKPINTKLMTLITDSRASTEDKIKMARHSNAYEDRAILSLSFLEAVVKNPAIAQEKAAQRFVGGITKQSGDPYRDRLVAASRAEVEKVLTSGKHDKLKGYDSATRAVIIDLYAHAMLATMSDSEQAKRMQATKDADAQKRKPGDYSQQAVEAGEAKGRAYNRQIGDIIASIPDRTDAQRQFMREMIAIIDVLRREDPQTNLEVMMAQAIHESAWGTSTIKDSNNLFGVKAGDSWTGKTVEAVGWESVDGQDVEYMMTWRAYDSYADSIRDHAKLIESQPWFQDAVAHKDDPAAYLDGLLNTDEPAYATDPIYKPKILQIIDANRIDEMISLLSERDKAVQDERDRARAAQQQAARERQKQEQQEQREQQGGMSNGQDILEGFMRKYGTQSGRIPASELSVVDLQGVKPHLQHEAAQRFAELNKAYKARFGIDMSITDHYRDYQQQEAVAKSKPTLAAIPGTSNHGWGLAVDMGDAVGNSYYNEKYEWMAENAPKYGWVNPGWAKPADLGGSEEKQEWWHWEYAGAEALRNPNAALET